MRCLEAKLVTKMIALKRIIKVAISIFYYLASLGKFIFLRWILKKSNQRLVILCYHGVPHEHRQTFCQHVRGILRAGKPCRLDILTSAPRDDLLIGVTFDDAFANIIHNALPVLHQNRIPATIFIPSGNLGYPPKWRIEQEWAYAKDRIMSSEELREILSPLVSIGSHSVSHEDLRKLSDEMVWWELLESKKSLEQIIERPIDLFAFPYGYYNGRSVALAQKAGYRWAFTSDPDVASYDQSCFLMGRFGVDFDDWRIEFWLKIRGAYAWRGKIRWRKQHLPKAAFSLAQKGDE